MRNILLKLIFAIAIISALSACGGSSGGAAPPPPAGGSSNWGEMVWGDDNWA